MPPPRSDVDISIIHSIKQVYTIIYQTGKKLPKSDKLGIHAYIEGLARNILELLISASFSYKNKKPEVLEKARILLEVLKHFVRVEYELHIIDEKAYIRIESGIIETSKMTNGWIKYLSQQNTPT
ncbi:MAG TPA: four helix bundle protein [Candidatus Paceibacterota bacterium]